MRVVAIGEYTTKPILDSDRVTALYIYTTDGEPAMILQMLPDKQGYIRLTAGEDPEFDKAVAELRINK